MEYIIIEVPDMNDSLSRIVLSGKEYQIRFTYNDTFDFWKFSLYTYGGEPIVLGIKIVPKIPLNLFQSTSQLPDGVFGVLTNLDRIGKKSFLEGAAKFIFCPVKLPDY